MTLTVLQRPIEKLRASISVRAAPPRSIVCFLPSCQGLLSTAYLGHDMKESVLRIFIYTKTALALNGT